jgi:hypothetical protein
VNARPRNTYTPGEPLPTELQAIGRPVTIYAGGQIIRAGVVVRVLVDPAGGMVYDLQGMAGGIFTDYRLGNLMNPQPGTFTFTP